MIGSLTQQHNLPMVTPAAILARIGWIHSNIFPASFLESMSTHCQGTETASVVFSCLKKSLTQHSTGSMSSQMFLKCYCYVSLYFLSSQVRINAFQKVLGLYRHHAPCPTRSLFPSTGTMGVIGYVTAKCGMKPAYHLSISVCDLYLKPMRWGLMSYSDRTTAYHNRPFTIKQSGYIGQSDNIKMWSIVYHYLIPFFSASSLIATSNTAA